MLSGVARLVVLDAHPGPAFVADLRRAWDAGDAVFPLDPRLPRPAAHALLDALRPSDPVEPGDALVVATSGTTGEPKGAVVTLAAVEAAARATSARLAVDPARDRWLSRLPLAHVGGLGVITRALLTATPLTFDAGDPTATLTSLVPTQLERMGPDADRYRAVLLGGSADWRAERAANVVRTYGLTETFGGVVYDGVPLDGTEVAIDEGGEIRLRAPSMLRAYRDDSSPLDADGWLRTGDAGELGDDGRLTVHGRIADVVVTGGEKVWPDPVERVLRTVPGVADVAVVGRPDAEWGHVVTAVVVPADPAAPPALEAMRDAVQAELAPWCAPRRVELVTDLPRTALGKVRRSAL